MTGRCSRFYPQMSDLTALVTAALARSSLPAGPLPPDVEPARASSTTPRSGPPRGSRRRGPRAHRSRRPARFLAWLRAVERAACRAGLLACGDVTIAARVLSVDGHAVGGLSAADRLRTSSPSPSPPRYADVRRTLGIAVRTSRVG